MSEVDVEELPVSLHHHIARVPVSYPHHVSRHQIPRTGTNVVLLCYPNVLFVVVGL